MVALCLPMSIKEAVISLKKFLATKADDGSTLARVVWLILEATACHAIESDVGEREQFQIVLRQIATKIGESTHDATTFVLAGEAIKSIEMYNRGVQRSLHSQVKELQSIVSLFARSMLHISKGSGSSATNLRLIERQIEKAAQIDDLRALKSQLELSLKGICDEAAQQEERGATIANQIRDTMSRPESAAMLTAAVSDIDLVTGLPSFNMVPTALGAAITDGRNAYAVLFCVDRIEIINSRFGPESGDRVLIALGQRLAQRFSGADVLFRWRGPGFLALIERTESEMAVRDEVTRLASARLEQEIELSGRSVLLPISNSWVLVALKNSDVEAVLKKLELFSVAQARAHVPPSS
jgi:diguanylate cyclase (GGDEF)-like protein